MCGEPTARGLWCPKRTPRGARGRAGRRVSRGVVIVPAWSLRCAPRGGPGRVGRRVPRAEAQMCTVEACAEPQVPAPPGWRGPGPSWPFLILFLKGRSSVLGIKSFDSTKVWKYCTPKAVGNLLKENHEGWDQDMVQSITQTSFSFTVVLVSNACGKKTSMLMEITSIHNVKEKWEDLTT